jgi:lysophospholipase L1-like esterase
MSRLTVLAAASALLAVAGTTATATAAHAATPAAASTTDATALPTVRVLPLGDSITYGRNSCSGDGYRGPLQQLAPAKGFAVDFVGSQLNGSMDDPANEGHPGYTVDQISAGVDGWLAATHPDVVLLHIGINDLNTYASGADTAAKATQLVNRIFADQPGVTVIMQGLIPTTLGINNPMPNMAANIPAFNSQLQQLEAAEQQAGRHFRFVAAPALTPAEFSDNLHPNDAGYALLGQNFLAPLDQAYKAHWFTGTVTQPVPPANTVRLVDLAPDGSLHNNEGDFNARSWFGWNGLGTLPNKEIPKEVTSAATFSVNRIFAIGSSGQVYEKDGNYATGQWTNWFSPKTDPLPVPAVAISASSLNHMVHLVAVGTDGQLWNNDGDYEAGQWTGWSRHSANNLTRVASATTADGVNHIFAVEGNGQLDELDADYCTRSWGDWTTATKTTVTGKDVAASAAGKTVHLSVVGKDGGWSTSEGHFDTHKWSDWMPMTSAAAAGGAPFQRIASAAANNVNHVFAVDTNNRLWEIDGTYADNKPVSWNDWAPAAGGIDSIGVTASFTR